MVVSMRSLLAAALCVFAWGCGAEAQTPVPASVGTGTAPPAEEKVATFAGGCFWCTEAVFEQMKGVNDVVSGYTGDESKPNPTYEQVCAKLTNHAEAIQIYYDPSVVSYDDLLEVFFSTHDPTTPNRQGNDVGPQYRSAVFYKTPQEKQAVEAMIEKLDKAKKFRRPIVTEVSQLGTWWDAEEYHQDFYRRNPFNAYCRATAAVKVKKFKNLFEDKVREDGVGSRREQ